MVSLTLIMTILIDTVGFFSSIGHLLQMYLNQEALCVDEKKYS